MFELTEIVVPRVTGQWESLAYCMRYTTDEVAGFKKDASPKESCTNMFSNWVTTGHDPKPKTYQTLLKHLKKIDSLTKACEEIEKELLKGKCKKIA